MSNPPALKSAVSSGVSVTNAPEDTYTASVAESHRKGLGQFFTPAPAAEFMAKWVIGNPSCRTILDPAVGLGIFFRSILKLKQASDYKFIGYDIDSMILGKARSFFADFGRINLELKDKDYLYGDWDKKYDGIICNPPYFKFQDYKNRTATLREFKTRASVNLSGFTNIYTMFMLKSVNQLSPNGRAAYLIPFEFLNSDYGTTVKKLLLESRTLRYVVLFSPDENVFSNALTTSCILLFAKDGHSKAVSFIRVRRVDELRSLSEQVARYPDYGSRGKLIPHSDLDPLVKWRAYYQKQSGKQFRNLTPLSAYVKVVRGIATGDNDYFTFDEKKKVEFGIGDENLLPCITKAAQAKSGFFTIKDYEDLRLNGNKVLLLNAKNLRDKAVKRYVELGEKLGVNTRYLTSHRAPWYTIENRPPAPLLVMVFNRTGLRFVRNEADVRNLTCFHSVYPNIFASDKVNLLMAYFLTDVSKEIINDNRREYGGGLNKFEPNDLNQAMMLNLDVLDARTVRLIQQTYETFRTSVLNSKPDEDALEKLNGIFTDALTK